MRVQARRLRAKLVRYYREEGRADETVIELPKGGYAPVFKQRDTPVLIKRTGRPRRWSAATPIAVLPFADHSAERDLEYFCRGLRQEIIHSLARFASLRILAVRRPPRADRRQDRRGDDHQRQRAQIGRRGCAITASSSTARAAATSGRSRWTRRWSTCSRRRSGRRGDRRDASSRELGDGRPASPRAGRTRTSPRTTCICRAAIT